MDEWLAQWLVDGKFIDADCVGNFDAFKFLENHPNKDKIFGKLCIGGLCHNLDTVDGNILLDIGREYAWRHLIVPIERKGEDLYVAMWNPFAINVIDDLSARLKVSVICMLAKREIIVSFFSRSASELHAMNEQVNLAKEHSGDVAAKHSITAERDESASAEEREIPLDRLFGHFMELAANMRASDIHFECNRNGMRVRFRVDGKLTIIQQLDQNLARAIISNVKLHAKLKLDETRLPQDGRLKAVVNGRQCDVRVSIIPNIYGENAVLRIFNANSEEFSIHNIGLSDLQISYLEALLNLDSGLLLIAGSTGSGKTTTIYSMLKHLLSPTKKIITIEDPIEHVLPDVSQVAVDEKIGLTFTHILRAVLRQAPNVIFIGEIRDSETAHSTIQAALTGHLILSTVHAGSSEEAITRLHDLGISKYLIDSCVYSVIFQELMRLKCKFCKGGGHCDVCSGRGYYGRIGVFEMLVSDDFAGDKSPSKFDSFGFLCTMKNGMAKLQDILAEKI
ncbi:MAG: GspE/PulE family protein [Puniceicoccales bacterium]|jgi:type II secretory ATPase GspE/PulE/Tfp pilus assembly ATPase PilB-like protein|nr:GspE/PulE family protein [Puniceicoccales bacterium]